MLPNLVTKVPGTGSRQAAELLRNYECRDVTDLSSAGPIFWERAEGVNVWDVDGNRFLDMTSAFSVAGLGYGRQEISEAAKKQIVQLGHGMGDVHPTLLKAELCRELSRMTFERWGVGRGRVTLGCSGFEAVEVGLKSAFLKTGRRGVVSFFGGYHGLGYGALAAIGLSKFREPFRSQVADFGEILPFPSAREELPEVSDLLSKLDGKEIGAVLVEPIQGRGGKIVPPEGFLRMLRKWCDETKAVLIFDEIYTGFHRSGKLFACDWEGVVPDVICLAKAMSGGFPISACVGRESVMDAWPRSMGEALHTSTHLGNPIGCAMALAALEIHAKPETARLVEELAMALESTLKGLRSPLIHEVRGRGAMWGIDLRKDGQPFAASRVIEGLLRRGIIILADGIAGNVLSFTPPFILKESDLRYVESQLSEVLTGCFDDEI